MQCEKLPTFECSIEISVSAIIRNVTQREDIVTVHLYWYNSKQFYLYKNVWYWYDWYWTFLKKSAFKFWNYRKAEVSTPYGIVARRWILSFILVVFSCIVQLFRSLYIFGVQIFSFEKKFHEGKTLRTYEIEIVLFSFFTRFVIHWLVQIFNWICRQYC